MNIATENMGAIDEINNAPRPPVKIKLVCYICCFLPPILIILIILYLYCLLVLAGLFCYV